MDLFIMVNLIAHPWGPFQIPSGRVPEILEKIYEKGQLALWIEL